MHLLAAYQISISEMLFLHALQTFGEHGDNLVEVTHDAEVGNLEDRSKFVLVDSDDKVTFFHTGEVLDGAADAASHIESRADCFTSLTNLTAGIHNTGVDHSTA